MDNANPFTRCRSFTAENNPTVRNYCVPVFVEEKTEVQRGLAACPLVHGLGVVGLGLTPRPDPEPELMSSPVISSPKELAAGILSLCQRGTSRCFGESNSHRQLSRWC